MDIMETIRDQVENNAVLLYMKGSPNQPQCGFSARTVQALMACGPQPEKTPISCSIETIANFNWLIASLGAIIAPQSNL